MQKSNDRQEWEHSDMIFPLQINSEEHEIFIILCILESMEGYIRFD